MESAYVVMRRKPASALPWYWRDLVRWIYRRIGWASDYSLELMGVYTNPAEARWASSGDGMCFMEVPLNYSLPAETCQYKAHEFPLSDAAADYRNRKLPFIAITRGDFEALDAKVSQTLSCAQGKCVPKVV